MVFGCVETPAKLQFSRTSPWSMVSILDSLHRFSFQFLKMVVVLSKSITYCSRMEGSNHENWNSIIYRKEAVHRTGIERPFLAVKGFNTNLAQFLPPYHVVISNVRLCSFTCTISHVCGRASKTVLRARNLVYEKL